MSFLGAYVFSLQVLYKRYVTNDLKPALFVSIAMRTLTQMASKLLKRAKFESFDERLPLSLLDGMNIDTELR